MSSQIIDGYNDIIFRDSLGWELARFTPDKFVVKDKAKQTAFELGELLAYQFIRDILWNTPVPVEGSLTINVGLSTQIIIEKSDYSFHPDDWCIGAYEITAFNSFIKVLQDIMK